jgi:3D-(3,5/4)-trihydroxycyclohexane-1,2-dione acylhydrolase (decyclizing)
MGYEIAGALGAKLATPERDVYAFLGDGSYLMLNHELATSIQEDLKITIILLNNHGYQCIHNLQRACGSQSLGNEFTNKRGMDLPIDFVKNAQSLGAKTFIAHDEETFLSALTASRLEQHSTLIYLDVERTTPLEGFSWWDVPVSQVSSERGVRDAREDYEQQSKEQLYYYGTSRH